MHRRINRSKRKRRSKLRKKIWIRDNRRCVYCLAQPKRGAFTIDHLIPISKKGTDDITNVVVSCKSCNNKKGCKLPLEYIWEIVSNDISKIKPFGVEHE